MNHYAFFQFSNKLLISLLILFANLNLYGTDCTAEFSYGTLNGTLPHSVTFTPSTSNSLPQLNGG